MICKTSQRSKVTSGVGPITFLVPTPIPSQLTKTGHSLKKPPHLIYKYDLQDIPKIKGHIRSRTDNFLSSDPHTKSADENWALPKDTIIDAMAQCIPSKMSKTKQDFTSLDCIGN